MQPGGHAWYADGMMCHPPRWYEVGTAWRHRAAGGRVIRGPDIAGPSHRSAKDRIPTLESRVGRSTFRTVEVTGHRSARTSTMDNERMALLRKLAGK